MGWKSRVKPDKIDHHIYPADDGTLPIGWDDDVLERTGRGQFVAVHTHSIRLTEWDMISLCDDDGCRVWMPPDYEPPE